MDLDTALVDSHGGAVECRAVSILSGDSSLAGFCKGALEGPPLLAPEELMRYLLITLLLFVNTVQAAPVPRERQQTEQTQFREADLYGTWMFEWGIILDTGFITFYKDGTFFYKHDVNGPICHCGTWTITNDVLELVDFTWTPSINSLGCPNTYLHALRWTGHGQFAATGFSKLRFSNHCAD